MVPSTVHAQEAYAVEQDGMLTFYYDENRKSHTEGELYNVETELRKYHSEAPRWCSSKLTKVVFDDSFSGYTFENASYMFSGCTNIVNVENLKALNLSETKELDFLFENCKSLESIDLNGLNTDNVESLWSMFYKCSSLKYVDLSPLFTGNVTNMSYMFADSGIESLNLSGINTSHVTDLNGMFTGCSAITMIDLSSFDTSNVTDMSFMFANCLSLTTIYVSDGWNISNVSSGNCMFLGCKNLVGENGTKNDGLYFSGGFEYACVDTDSTPGYLTYKAPPVAGVAYAVADGGVLSFYCDNNKDNRTGTVYDIEEEYAGDGNYPAWRGTMFTKVVFDSSFAAYQPTSTARWFHSCPTITEIEGMGNLDTSHSKSMGGMFYGCAGLKNLDLSAMNTSSATTMYTMFYECTGLESLDLSSFDTRNVTAMTAMFFGCTGLKQLNVSSFDTGNVEDMQYMFFKCTQLKSLGLSNFNTSKVTNMEAMFAHCDNAVSIDISSFETSKVQSMKTMFTFCGELRTIYASDLWSTESVVDDTSMMFLDCSKLIGGNGTVCDGIGWPNPIDHTYARIDEDGTPGYFTYKINPGIADAFMSDDKSASYWFSLDGKRTLPTKGVYIKNGKKILMK